MHRFKIDFETIASARAPLSFAEASHALRVLRLKDGQSVQALDGRGHMWNAVLRVEGGESAFLELKDEVPNAEAPVDVILYMGIPKGDKLEFLAQKLTEIGVRRLVPVRMERSVAKIDEKEKDKKLARLRKIAQEAQKQCGRGNEMEICDPLDFKAFVRSLAENDVNLFFWEEASGLRIRDVYERLPSARKIGCVIGPEGGISQKEADAIRQAGAQTLTLGPRILRAETAAVAAGAVIMSLWGDI